MLLLALLVLCWIYLAVCMVIILWHIHFLLGIVSALLLGYAFYKDITR